MTITFWVPGVSLAKYLKVEFKDNKQSSSTQREEF